MNYAGFQRYDVPDIGSNVAKIMLDKQQQANANAARQQQLDMQNKKLEAAANKDAAKAAQSVENEIDKNDTRIGAIMSTTPSTGFETMDGLLQGSMIPQIKTGMNEINKQYRNGTIGSAEYKTAKQSYENIANETKSTADGLNAAYAKMNSAKNPSPYKKWAINATMNEVNPSAESPSNVKLIRQPNGEINKVVQSFRKGENGENVLVSETPYRVINSMSAMTDFETPNFDQVASTMADNVGKEAIEIKSGGGTMIEINDKIQKNFIDTREQFANTILAQPVNAADFYFQNMTDPTQKPVFVKEDDTESYKRMLADNNGYLGKPLSEVNFIVSKKGDDGMDVPVLNDKQKEQTKNFAYKMFDNKADHTKSLNLPSISNNKITIVNNPERETQPTLTELSIPLTTTQGYNAAVAGLKLAQANGKISKNWEIVTDAKGVPTGDIKVYMQLGKYDGYPIYDKQPTIINAQKDPALYRILFGNASDARETQGQQESTYPKKR